MGLNPHSAFLSPVTRTHRSRVQCNRGNSNPRIQQISWSQKFLQPCPSRGSSCWWLIFFFLKYVLKWLTTLNKVIKSTNLPSPLCLQTTQKKKKNQLEYHLSLIGGFPGGAVVKNLPANAGASRDTGSIPGLRRSPGEGNGNPLQYSYLENPMDRGTW